MSPAGIQPMDLKECGSVLPIIQQLETTPMLLFANIYSQIQQTTLLNVLMDNGQAMVWL